MVYWRDPEANEKSFSLDDYRGSLPPLRLGRFHTLTTSDCQAGKERNGFLPVRIVDIFDSVPRVDKLGVQKCPH